MTNKCFKKSNICPFIESPQPSLEFSWTTVFYVFGVIHLILILFLTVDKLRKMIIKKENEEKTIQRKAPVH